MNLNPLFCMFASVMLAATSALAQSPRWILEEVFCHEVGAQLQYVTRVQGHGGLTKVVLDNLPDDVDVSDVQVDLPTGMKLVAIDQSEGVAGPSPDLLSMIDEEKALELSMALEAALLQSLEQEQRFLEANRGIAGSNDVLLVDDLDEMRHYVAQRHRILAMEAVELRESLKSMEDQLASLREAMAPWRREAGRVRRLLTLVLSGTGQGELTLRASTQQAGWVSSYDLSWEEGTGKLQVERYAKVIQSTGIDWNDVILNLRTGQPLGEMVGRQPVARRTLLQSSEADGDMGYCASYEWVSSGLRDDRARAEVLQGQGAFASNWQMTGSKPVSVNGNANPSRVWLDRVVLDASPRWEVRSGPSDAAAKSCHTTGWMELAMLSGEGRVFRGNTMVGGVPVNMPAWGDSLVVELGRDQEVRVKRSMLQDESGTRRWSGKTVVTQMRRIEVLNDKSYGVLVDVSEAIPEGPAMQVEVDATAGGTWNREGGQVEWPKQAIAAGETWTADVRIRLVLPPGVRVSNF